MNGVEISEEIRILGDLKQLNAKWTAVLVPIMEIA